MNFRELINQLEAIDQPILSETVTLDSIMAAVGKEPDEQKRADLLQKMAEKENLPGLYDPVSGYFVSVFQDREPMTNQMKARISSTASSDVTNQLADLGLVPSKANTRSLGGLVGVGALSNSTEKNDEMDREVKNRFKNKQPAASGTAAVDSANKVTPQQAPKLSSAEEEEKMTQLEGLVDIYLEKKAAVLKKSSTKLNTPKSASNQTVNDGNADSGSSPGEQVLKTGVGTAAGYVLGNNPKPNAKGKVSKLRPTPAGVASGLIGGYLGSQMPESIAKSLVESFGYQKKTSLEEIVESLGLRKDYPYGYQFLKEAATTNDLTIGDEEEDDDYTIPDSEKVEKAVRQKVYGAGGSGLKAIRGIGKTMSGNNKKPVSKEPQSWFDAAFHNKYWNNWTEDSLSWDDEIIPGFEFMDGEPLYTFRDLGLDLGIAAGFVMVGTIMAPFTAGASVPVAAAAGVGAAGIRMAGTILIRLLIKIAIAIIKAVKLYGKPIWELAKANPTKFIKAVGQIAKTHLEAFYNGMAKQFSALPFLNVVFWTMGFNAMINAGEKYLPDYIKKPIGQGFDWVTDKAKKAFDGARKITGLEEGLA